MSRKLVVCFCEVREDGVIVVSMLDGLPGEVIAATAAAVVKYVEAKGVTPQMLKEHVDGTDVRLTGLVRDPSVN